MKRLVEWRNKVLYFLKPCRAMARPTPEDPDPLLHSNFIRRSEPWMTPLMEFPLKPWRKNMWSLDLLGIHPKWQGRGYGKELVRWGLEQAKGDRLPDGGEVPAVVVSAEGKEVFYQKSGFKEIVGYQTEEVESIGEKNPFRSRGIGGGAVIWSWVGQDESAAATKAGVKGVGTPS